MGTAPPRSARPDEARPPRLSRPADGRPAAPVRLVHLGLGSFFRAHQAAYTADAPDAAEWGYAAFTGRRPDAALALAPQQGLYTLVTRAAAGDLYAVVPTLSEVYAADHAAWCRVLAAAPTAVVTLTVTEAGYHRAPGGGLALTDPTVAADLAVLRTTAHVTEAGHSVPNAAPTTPVGRLIAGFAERRATDNGPLAVVPCDNLPDNGVVLRGLVLELAERVEPALAAWIDAMVSFVTTVVDRITPAATAAGRAAVAAATGRFDASPVVTEPFREWVLAGRFPGGRPQWEEAGAAFVSDAAPFAQRKLWLLNGAHSLLAYTGPRHSHPTVAGAIADDTCRAWVEQWWDEAAAHLPLPAADVATYRAALVERFANPRIAHQLAQISADGSQKLPVRVLPVVHAERAAGRVPIGAARILAAWLCHLRGNDAPVTDPRAAELTHLATGPLPDATTRILASLDPALADDHELRTTMAQLAAELETGHPRHTGLT